MKSERGVTLTSLIIYILVMTLVVAAVGVLTAYFYKNASSLDEGSASAAEYNRFNMYFLSETKISGNGVYKVGEDEHSIVFLSDTNFIFKDNTIYMNYTRDMY